MPQNKMIDLQNHLFEEMERLNDEEAMKDPEYAKREISRARAMAGIGTVMVNNTNNAIKAQKLVAENPGIVLDSVPLLNPGEEPKAPAGAIEAPKSEKPAGIKAVPSPEKPTEVQGNKFAAACRRGRGIAFCQECVRHGSCATERFAPASGQEGK